MKSPLRGPSTRTEAVVGLIASAGAVVFVTMAIAVLKPQVPVLSLGVLYSSRSSRLPCSGASTLATVVSVASMLAFNWFFLPPTHTFQLSDAETGSRSRSSS